MADFDQATYQPQEADIYIQEVRAGRFTIHRYQSGRWERIEPVYSKQELEGLISVMQFLGESKSKRRYYRPLYRYHIKA